MSDSGSGSGSGSRRTRTTVRYVPVYLPYSAFVDWANAFCVVDEQDCCEENPSDSGSGSDSDDSGAGPTGCCDPAPPNTLTVTITGSCGSHTFPIVWDGESWNGTTGDFLLCDGTSAGLALSCDSGTYTLNPVASWCGPGFVTGLIPTSCSPFLLSYSGAESGLCGGTITITISEPDPEPDPPPPPPK